MPKREYDFDDAKKEKVKARYRWTCAACGCDDRRFMHVDHWHAGDHKSPGVCLCGACNLAKGTARLPMKPLLPRDPCDPLDKPTHDARMEINRKAWEDYVSNYRGKRGKSKAFAFEAPH